MQGVLTFLSDTVVRIPNCSLYSSGCDEPHLAVRLLYGMLNSVDLAATTLVANDCEQRASAFAKVK